MSKGALLLLVILVLASFAEVTLDAVRVEEAPVLDGELNDSCWGEASVIEGFIQRDPLPGEPSTELTRFRLCYTEYALYAAFECTDSEPAGIVSRLRRRDSSLTNDDNVDLWIDPTGAGLQLYYFATNPRGCKFDCLYNHRATHSNYQYDAHWNVAAAVNPGGWAAEFEIPFSNFKFDYDPDQPWLFNAGRVIRRKSEETYAVEVPYDHNMFYTEDAVRLTGIEGVSQGLGLEIVPYAKGDYRIYPLLSEDDKYDFNGIGGVDIDFDIGSNLTLATTVLSDYAEIDLDPDQYQIGFGQLYTPETRPFFLRDSNYFYTVPCTAFYSRRIGKRLFDSDGIYHDAQIVAGGRLTGKLGPVGIGAFYAHTDEAVTDISSEPESDWGVARVTLDVAPNSFIGIVGAGRLARAVELEGIGTQPAYDFGSYGLDFDVYWEESVWNVWGGMLATYDSRYEKNDIEDQFTASLGLCYRMNNFETWVFYNDAAPRFNIDETGYIYTTNLRNFQVNVGYDFVFGDSTFRNLSISAQVQMMLSRDWEYDFQQYTFMIGSATNFNWHFSAGCVFGSDGLYYGPDDPQSFVLGTVNISTDPSAPIHLYSETWYGDLIDYTTFSVGDLLHQNAGLIVHPFPELSLEAELEYNQWWMREGEFAGDYNLLLWRGTVSYLFTRELYLRLFGQGAKADPPEYYSENGRYVFRALLGWEFLPDSNIYLAYEQWRDDSGGDFTLINQGVFLKADYFLQL